MEALDRLQEKIRDIQEKLQDLWEYNRTPLLIGVSGAAVLLILIIVLCAVQCSSPEKAEINEKFEATDSFVFPENLSLVDDYYFSREEAENWSQDEADLWFTDIDSKALKDIKDTNDEIIDELLGAAP